MFSVWWYRWLFWISRVCFSYTNLDMVFIDMYYVRDCLSLFVIFFNLYKFIWNIMPALGKLLNTFSCMRIFFQSYSELQTSQWVIWSQSTFQWRTYGGHGRSFWGKINHVMQSYRFKVSSNKKTEVWTNGDFSSIYTPWNLSDFIYFFSFYNLWNFFLQIKV